MMKFKNSIKLLSVFTVLAFVFNACDDKTPDPLSTEDSKDQIDASMASVAEDLSDITTLRMLDLSESMMAMEMEAPAFKDLIEPASKVEGTSIEEMEEAMEAGLVNVTLSDQLIWGTYTYDFDNSAFLFEEGEVGTYIVYSPSSAEMTENDVEVKLVVKFQDVDLSQDYTETYWESTYDENGYWSEEKVTETITINVMEIFTDVDFSIKQNGETIMAYAMGMTMDDDDMVNSMATSFSVDDYKIATEFNAKKRSDKITHQTSFTKGSSEIAGYSITFDGNMSDEKIEEIMEEIQNYDETDEYPSESFDNSLDYNVEAELRLGDFVISGLADADGIYKGSREYDEKYENGEFADDLAEADFSTKIFNDNISLVLKKKNGAAVGIVEFFTSEYEETYYGGETETYYETSVRFKFEDGTYISPEDEDAEEQILDIFQDFIDAMNDLADEIAEVEERFEE